MAVIDAEIFPEAGLKTDKVRGCHGLNVPASRSMASITVENLFSLFFRLLTAMGNGVDVLGFDTGWVPINY